MHVTCIYMYMYMDPILYLIPILPPLLIYVYMFREDQAALGLVMVTLISLDHVTNTYNPDLPHG